MAISSEGQQGLQALNNGFWNAVNLGWNTIQNWKDKEWQAKFWKLTYDQQLKDTLRYNSPAAQLARMKQAGLNPNLMYGNGVGTTPFSFGGQPGTISSHGANAVPNYDPLVQSQIEVNKAQADDLEASANKKNEETKGVKTTNAMLEEQLKYMPQQLKLDVETKQQELLNLAKDGQLTAAKIDETAANTKKLMADKGYTEAQTALVEEQTKYVGYYALLEGQKVSLSELDLELKACGLELTAEGIKIERDKADADIDYKGALKALTEAEEKYTDKKTGAVKHEIIQGYLGAAVGLLRALMPKK